MLEPYSCTPTTAGRWALLSWAIFNRLLQQRLLNASLIFVVLVGLILLPWVLRWRWRRQMTSVAVGLVIIFLAALSPMALSVSNRLLTAFLPDDAGQPADAIVVLGRGPGFRPQRVEVASRLWQEHRAPLIFASGRGDAKEIAQMLVEQGVPTPAIQGEPCSSTTEENAQFTAALLPPNQFQRIILVTDPPHMLRSLLTFRSIGFTVIPHLSPLPEEMTPRRQRFLLFREYLGLVSYGIRGRFLPRTVAADLSARQERRSLQDVKL